MWHEEGFHQKRFCVEHEEMWENIIESLSSASSELLRKINYKQKIEDINMCSAFEYNSCITITMIQT